jgi:hypothetical protein
VLAFYQASRPYILCCAELVSSIIVEPEHLGLLLRLVEELFTVDLLDDARLKNFAFALLLFEGAPSCLLPELLFLLLNSLLASPLYGLSLAKQPMLDALARVSSVARHSVRILTD